MAKRKRPAPTYDPDSEDRGYLLEDGPSISLYERDEARIWKLSEGKAGKFSEAARASIDFHYDKKFGRTQEPVSGRLGMIGLIQAETAESTDLKAFIEPKLSSSEKLIYVYPSLISFVQNNGQRHFIRERIVARKETTVIIRSPRDSEAMKKTKTAAMHIAAGLENELVASLRLTPLLQIIAHVFEVPYTAIITDDYALVWHELFTSSRPFSNTGFLYARQQTGGTDSAYSEIDWDAQRLEEHSKTNNPNWDILSLCLTKQIKKPKRP